MASILLSAQYHMSLGNSTTMREHCTPSRGAKIQLWQHQMLMRVWNNKNPLLLRMQNGKHNTVWQFLAQLDTLLPYDLAMTLLGTIFK